MRCRLVVALLVAGFLTLASSAATQQLPRPPTVPLRPPIRLMTALELPPLHRWIAEDQLATCAALPGWQDAVLDTVFPVYEMDGETLAYYEVKVRTGRGDDAGYVMLSATEKDTPVVEFSHHGLTHHERFAREIDGDFRMLRFGPGYVVAEDAQGRLLAEIGFRPPILPDEVMKELQELPREEGEQRPGTKPERMDEPEPLRQAMPEQWEEPLPYDQWKSKLDPSAFFRPTEEDILWEWDLVRTLYKQSIMPVRSTTVSASDRRCRMTIDWAAGIANMPYLLQIPGKTPPNNNRCASGCGPTAWMNIYSWHRRNFVFVPYDSSRYNTAWLNDRTMGIRSYLGTFGIGCQGFTWPHRMRRGIPYAESRFGLDVYYFWRFDLGGIFRKPDTNWVFQVARSMGLSQRPFIVGYWSDLHYAVGLGVMQCLEHTWQRHSWVYIYPAWSPNDSQNKWIRKGDIFGLWGIYAFYTP